jgi:hypothetical protein
MAFQIATHTLPGANDYAAALRVYEKAKPFRFRSETPWSLEGHRALKDNRARHLTVRMAGDDVIFRLHSTDCVTWRKDGSCVVRGYPSVSTSMFISLFTPMWASAGMTSQIGEMMWVRPNGPWPADGPVHGYWIADACTLHPDRTVEGTQPIPVPRLNLKRAAQARKESGFNDYLAWWRARQAIERGRLPGGDYAYEATTVVDRLRAGGRAWIGLQPPEGVLPFVYREYKCVDVEHLPHLTGYSHEKAVRAAQSKYSYYRWLT